MAKNYLRCPACREVIDSPIACTTCDRCGTEGEFNGIDPAGWVWVAGAGRLCPECNHAFNIFMKAGTDGQ